MFPFLDTRHSIVFHDTLNISQSQTAIKIPLGIELQVQIRVQKLNRLKKVRFNRSEVCRRLVPIRMFNYICLIEIFSQGNTYV